MHSVKEGSILSVTFFNLWHDLAWTLTISPHSERTLYY